MTDDSPGAMDQNDGDLGDEADQCGPRSCRNQKSQAADPDQGGQQHPVEAIHAVAQMLKQ